MGTPRQQGTVVIDGASPKQAASRRALGRTPAGLAKLLQCLQELQNLVPTREAWGRTFRRIATEVRPQRSHGKQRETLRASRAVPNPMSVAAPHCEWTAAVALRGRGPPLILGGVLR